MYSGYLVNNEFSCKEMVNFDLTGFEGILIRDRYFSEWPEVVLSIRNSGPAKSFLPSFIRIGQILWIFYY